MIIIIYKVFITGSLKFVNISELTLLIGIKKNPHRSNNTPQSGPLCSNRGLRIRKCKEGLDLPPSIRDVEHMAVILRVPWLCGLYEPAIQQPRKVKCYLQPCAAPLCASPSGFHEESTAGTGIFLLSHLACCWLCTFLGMD